MRQCILIMLFLLLLGACHSKVTDKIDPSLKRQLTEAKLACDRGECPCVSPVGSVAHGSKVTTYSQQNAGCEEGCGKYAEDITCNNGKFDKELAGRLFKCEVLECPSCTLGNNLILSGETVDTYNTEIVGCHESCEDFKQRRTCKLGILSGSDDYHFFSCKRKTCRCYLPDGSAYVSLDGQIKLYSTERAACGKTCDNDYAQTRTCISQLGDGDEETFVFDGNSLYEHRTCQEATGCLCRLPNGLPSLGDGLTEVISDTLEVNCGESCATDPGINSITVKCDNGELRNNANLSEVIKIDTRDNLFESPFKNYKHVCEPKECISCSVRDVDDTADDIRRNHGDTHTFYRTNSPTCSESCPSVSLARRCNGNDGSFEGDERFSKASCEPRSCICDVNDGSGRHIPEGDPWNFYSAESAACGHTCAELEKEKTCDEREEPPNSGEYVYEFQPTGDGFDFPGCSEATGCSCTLPGGLGLIVDGDTFIVTSLSETPCNTSCGQIDSLSVKCDNGTFKNNANLNQTIDFSLPAYASYQYECAERVCRECEVPGEGTLRPHGGTFVFFSTSSPACGPSQTNRLLCSDFDQTKTCNDGTFEPEGDEFTQTDCEERYCKCDVPGESGTYVWAGDDRNFYSRGRAECAHECTDYSSPKTCVEREEPPDSGNYVYEFQGDAAYSFSSCDPPIGCACSLPRDLGMIENGLTVTLTSESAVPCRTPCSEVPSLAVRCDNGLLKRASDDSLVNISDPDYQYNYFCIQGTCSSCDLPGYGSIDSGDSITLYSQDVQGCGEEPDSFTYEFMCDNEVLMRNGSPYDPLSDPDAPETWHVSYSPDCPGCELPWGGFIDEGVTINAYKFFGTVINNCGRGCKVSERKCENGVLTGDSSYDMQSCDNSCNMEGGGAPPRVCLLRWQNSFVTPDTQIPVWNRREVACGESCQNHFMLSRCNMETGTFDVPFDYIYQSCTEICP